LQNHFLRYESYTLQDNKVTQILCGSPPQIALTVAEKNGCDYCLAAHSTIGKMVGLSIDQIQDSRSGSAVDRKQVVANSTGIVG